MDRVGGFRVRGSGSKALGLRGLGLVGFRVYRNPKEPIFLRTYKKKS